MDFIEICITVNNVIVPPPMRAAIKESLELMRDKEVEKHRRTMTTFLHYVNYMDPNTGRPIIRDLLGDYVIGGKYGNIFDASSTDLSLDTRFLAFEMEALMNRGENCVVPALEYLFNLIDKKFDGRFALLILDEAWLFLRNEIFADKITEWLKVLRKKNVYVVFATQEIADIVNSPLKTTILQQCMTKIYLADPTALTPGMMSTYLEFGLTESEISLIASATMKRDYFYTSPKGRRLFQLDLGQLTLALIGAPDHTLLDELSVKYAPGSHLCAEILAAKRINYSRFLDDNSPIDPEPVLRTKKTTQLPKHITVAPQQEPKKEPTHEESPDNTTTLSDTKNNEFLDAIAALPARKRNDGSGRSADAIADLYKVSRSTVYQARRILKEGRPELIEELRMGTIPVKTAYKRLQKELQKELA